MPLPIRLVVVSLPAQQQDDEELHQLAGAQHLGVFVSGDQRAHQVGARVTPAAIDLLGEVPAHLGQVGAH